LPLRDRILLELDMTNALRPSELFALRWKCFNHAEAKMQVLETAYKGALRPWGKTKKSLGGFTFPKRWPRSCGTGNSNVPTLRPRGLHLRRCQGGFMDAGNYRRRVLHKPPTGWNCPTFQLIRRTIATLAQKKGTIKDVKGLLRHSRAATTTDVYMQEIPESVQATINAIHAELKTKPQAVVAG